MDYSGDSQVALEVKNQPAKAGDIRDTGSISGSGRSPGGGHGSPLQYSCRENPLDTGAGRGGGLYSPWGSKATEGTKHTTHKGRDGGR